MKLEGSGTFWKLERFSSQWQQMYFKKTPWLIFAPQPSRLPMILPLSLQHFYFQMYPFLHSWKHPSHLVSFSDPFLQCCGLPQSRVCPRTAIFDFAHVIGCGTSFLPQMALLLKLCVCERDAQGSSHYPGSLLTFVLMSSTSACVYSFSKCSFTKSLQHFRLHAKGWQYKGKWKTTMFIFCPIDRNRTCRKFGKITPFFSCLVMF